jgi:sporulation protein YlmC with PRC-barrel domain
MKASDFIGRTVIDSKGHEVGKVDNIFLKPTESLLSRIVVSTGPVLNRKQFAITNEDIVALGDYIILNIDSAEIDKRISESKSTLELLKRENVGYKDLLKKIVISCNGVAVGTVDDLIIEPQKCLLETIVVKPKFDLSKHNVVIKYDDILDIKDYLVLKYNFEKVLSLFED